MLTISFCFSDVSVMLFCCQWQRHLKYV